MKYLTPSEQELMDLLWRSPVPLSCREIQAKLREYRSISRLDVVLDRLLKRKMIRAHGIYNRSYMAAVGIEEYWARLIHTDGPAPSLCRMIAELCKADPPVVDLDWTFDRVKEILKEEMK